MTSSQRNNAAPQRGEVWAVAFDPAPPALRGEQAFPRPALVISSDTFNIGPAGLVIVLPLTRAEHLNPLHIGLTPPEGGIIAPSFILCDQIMRISRRRLSQRLGLVRPATITSVEDALQILLDL